MICEKNGVSFVHFENFDLIDFVVHGFSTRKGGVSTGKYAGMNLGFGRGESRETVLENYQRIGTAIGFDPQQLVLSNQVHQDHIHVVTAQDAGKGIVKPSDITDIDALITNTPGVVLTTFYADCVPLFLVDPVEKAIGLAHSGWKGTTMQIGAKTIQQMSYHFGTKPENLIVAIGPSICGECFEVDEPVANAFFSALPDCRPYIKYQKENNKYYIDLWRINEHILIQAGVKEKAIQRPAYCTRCNPDLFYSHRSHGNERGSLAAFLGIKEENFEKK